jgi:hypothetical protein
LPSNLVVLMTERWPDSGIPIGALLQTEFF